MQMLSGLRGFVYTLIIFICCPLQGLGSTDTIPGLIKSDNAFHFLVVGDWGQNGSEGQKKVAAAMSNAGKQLGISFIVSTGDNFYPAGVQDINDPKWQTNFENIYASEALMKPWLAVLGNHDYQLNAQAQVDYTYQTRHWFMPSRYFDTSIAIGQDSLLLVFLDTEPLERMVRGKTDSIALSATIQLNWLRSVLATSHAKFRMVVGHHPLHTGGARRHNSRVRKLRAVLQPIFQQNMVDLYLAGHEHQLEYLKPPGNTHYIISGAGSETRHLGWFKRYRKFGARKLGFLGVSVSPAGYHLQFISDAEKLLYHRFIEK